MRQKLILIALIPALLLTFAVTYAEAGRGGGPISGDDSRAPFGRLAQRLDLTDDQVKQFEEIRDAKAEARAKLRKDLRLLRHELEGLMMQDRPDAGQVRKLAEKIGAVHTNMQINMLETRLALREILTEKQRDRMMGALPGPGGLGFFGCRFDGMGERGPDCDYNGRGHWGNGRGRGHGGEHGPFEDGPHRGHRR